MIMQVKDFPDHGEKLAKADFILSPDFKFVEEIRKTELYMPIEVAMAITQQQVSSHIISGELHYKMEMAKKGVH